MGQDDKIDPKDVPPFRPPDFQHREFSENQGEDGKFKNRGDKPGKRRPTK